MKLKLVVASMSVLGLISCPLFAATNTEQKASHKMVKHKVKHQIAFQDYKDMGALPIHQTPLVMSDWFNRITVDGGMNFDTRWGNRSLGYQGENNQSISLNDVHFNINANINNWSKLFAALSFDNTSGVLTGASTSTNPLATTFRPKPGKYSNFKDARGINLEQAYMTLSNPDECPLYFKLGKQFVDFGKYDLHPITRTMAQSLSQTLRTAVTVGFSTPMGFHGSVYTFSNSMRQVGDSHTKLNYGGAFGYDHVGGINWDAGVGYLYQMVGVEDVAYAVGIFNGSNNTGGIGGGGAPNVGLANTNASTTGTFVNRVGATALYGDLSSGPFSFGLRYVTAMQVFNATDLLRSKISTVRARPCALDLQGGYGFNAMGKSQNVYLGYQGSQDALYLYLPKHRWLAGYDVDMWKYTNLGVEVDHDLDYALAAGGTANYSNSINLRVAVKFS